MASDIIIRHGQIGAVGRPIPQFSRCPGNTGIGLVAETVFCLPAEISKIVKLAHRARRINGVPLPIKDAKQRFTGGRASHCAPFGDDVDDAPQGIFSVDR